MCVCVCVCVCDSERGRDRERKRDSADIVIALNVNTLIDSTDKLVYVDWFLVSPCVCRRHTHRPPSPVPSCVSMKSDMSIPLPLNFSSEPVPSGLK